MRSFATVTAVAVLALCAAPHHSAGQDASATVTTVFDLYGASVEPFDSTKQTAIKTALAQSAGHGVTVNDVQISVDATYSAQQNNGRRLLQSSNLVQAGVQLTSNVQTTQQLASSVGQSIDQALQNNQIAQVYNQNGGQADYTSVVTASSTNGDSGSSPSGTSPSGSDSSSNNSSSGSTNSSSSNGSSKGSSFPTWVIALIVILVLLLVGLVVGCVVWRKCSRRRAIQEQEFQAATYFSNSNGFGSKVSDTWGGIKDGTLGFFSKFRKAPLPIVATTSPVAEGGLARNPTTPFSTVGFGGSPTPGIMRTGSSGNLNGDKYGGFVTRGPTTPKGSSIPLPNAYQAAPKVSAPGSYTPKRVGRLESLKDINNI